MKSIKQEKVFRQCLSLIPSEPLRCPLRDYRNYKLSTEALVKIFVMAQLGRWSSYEDIEEQLRAYPELRKELKIKEISGSQLSRRITTLPTELLQQVFVQMVAKIMELTRDQSGINPTIGRLKIVDATHIKLPEQLCDWAYVTKGWNVVKMHTRLVVTSADTAFPDKILPSNGFVSDYEGSDVLVETTDATYVMDRGYTSTKRLERWIDEELLFVVRIKKDLGIHVQETYTPTKSSVLQDAKVTFGKSAHTARLVEFLDEKNRSYRLLTTRWDLTDEQIMEIYKNRWIIELFFKWIKQHLRVTKIWSTNPQGIWNQMFLGLIAYGVSLMVKLQKQTTKTQWQILQLLRIYLYKPTQELEEVLNRRKKKTSKGRQKVPLCKEKKTVFVGSVAMIKTKPKKKKN